MDTILEIIKINQFKYKFVVNFKNNGNKMKKLPVDKLKNSAEMIGLHFEINDERLEPIDFRVISKKNHLDTIVNPDQQISMEFVGSIEKRSEKCHCLSFKNASYRIVSGEKYKVWFSLEGYVSESVGMVFDF